MAASSPSLDLMPSAVRSAGLTTGVVFGLVSAFTFSTSGPMVKPLLEAGWSLAAVLLVRMAVAGLLLSPLLVRAERRDPGLIARRWRIIVGFGLTGVAGCQLLYFAAMQRMPVAVALLLQYLAPILLVLWAWARTRRTPSRLVIGGSLAALVGLVLVVDVTGARFDLLGTLFALGAAVCVALYFVILDRAADDVPPLAFASGGLLTGAVLMGVLGVTGILPFAAPPVEVVLAGMTVPWFVPLIWVAAVATTLGYAFGVLAVPRLGSRLASFVGLSEVLFAVGFAWVLLGEQPSLVQALGGALIVGGVVLVRADAGAQPRGEAARLPAAPSA